MKREKKENNISLFSKSCFLGGLFLLLFVFLNILIPSFLFIFKISMQSWYPILSLILSTLIILVIMKKNDLLVKKVGIYLSSIIIPILAIIGSVYVNGKVYDYTWDGNSYHKSSIGSMIDGWNPLYEGMEDFDSKQENPKKIQLNSYLWGNHYAKASHIYAASIGSLTKNVEAGKSINMLSIIALFMFSFSIIYTKKKKVLFSLLLSSVMISCPTICAQYLTNYVDLLVFLYLFMLIEMFFTFDLCEIFKKKDIAIGAYIMILVILINIKFSSFGYAGLFCLGYYLWYLYRLYRKDIESKFLLKFTIASAIAVIIGVFVVGLSVYPKNFIDHGHPFYPLMGEGKEDIMTANQPDYFSKKNSVEKFIIATFSRADNISQASGLEAKFKIPFSVYKTELPVMYSCDLRISGNGLFFSGILIISLVVVIINAYKTYKENKKLFMLMYIPIFITLLMIVFLEESWWARYFPQIHFIVFAAILLLSKYKHIATRILMYLLITLILVNNSIVFVTSTTYINDYRKEVNKQFKVYDEHALKCDIEVYTQSFHGIYFNLAYRNKEYNLEYVDSIKQEELGYYGPLFNGYVVWRCKQ